MTDIINLALAAEQTGQRLDKALAVQLAAQNYSRTRLQQLIAAGAVLVNGVAITDTSLLVQGGETIEITPPPAIAAVPQAQALPLAIVYEDKDLLIIDKPPGLVVHPAAGHYDHTLVNALIAHCGTSLSGIGGVARPGIVHRLDKDTSGLLVVAKHDRAHHGLAAQFEDRSLSRTYQAFVWDMPQPKSGEIDLSIGRDYNHRQKMTIRPLGGGKSALTYYKVTENFGTRAALVTCNLATGRTHQIRVHLAHIGHPVIGDPVYGRPRRGTDPLTTLLRRFPRQALHAAALKLIHPMTGKSMEFKSLMSPDLIMLWRELKAYNGSTQ
jgi:23S rRNA pseudouridine1911/1915/1917 synthase